MSRHGRVVAVIVRPDALRTRRSAKTLAESEQLSQLLVGMKDQPRPDDSLSNDRAEELVAAVRADRDQA